MFEFFSYLLETVIASIITVEFIQIAFFVVPPTMGASKDSLNVVCFNLLSQISMLIILPHLIKEPYLIDERLPSQLSNDQGPNRKPPPFLIQCYLRFAIASTYFLTSQQITQISFLSVFLQRLHSVYLQGKVTEVRPHYIRCLCLWVQSCSEFCLLAIGIQSFILLSLFLIP